VVTACWAPRRQSFLSDLPVELVPGSADGKLVAFDPLADGTVPDRVFAKGANIAVGAHPPVSPLDRRGTEFKLRRWSPRCARMPATRDLLPLPPKPVTVPRINTVRPR
jgi:hypothetical protein